MTTALRSQSRSWYRASTWAVAAKTSPTLSAGKTRSQQPECDTSGEEADLTILFAFPHQITDDEHRSKQESQRKASMAIKQRRS